MITVGIDDLLIDIYTSFFFGELQHKITKDS